MNNPSVPYVSSADDFHENSNKNDAMEEARRRNATRIKKWAVLSLGISVFLAFMIAGIVTFRKQVDRGGKYNDNILVPVDPSTITLSTDLTVFTVDLRTFQPNSKASVDTSVSYQTEHDQYGIYIDGMTPRSRAVRSIADTLNNPSSATFNAASGNIIDYPFDKYTFEPVFCFFLSSTNTTSFDSMVEYSLSSNNTAAQKVVAGLVFQSTSLVGWDVKLTDVAGFVNTTADQPYHGCITGKLSFKRSSGSLIYPSFIMIAFWGVSLIALVVAIKMVFFSSESVPPPIFGAYIGLIFAIPSVRNTLTSVTTFGCSLDFYSFFWSLAIAVICLIIISFKFFLQLKIAS